jgi:signal peptidase I
MNLQWFVSKTVRQATAMRNHVRKLLNHQRDVLPAPNLEGMSSAAGKLEEAIKNKADKATLEKQMENLEDAAKKWLKPYPNAAWRENIEVLLVALTVAMGIRTFFLQPFKIPTGSMQPTLYGVTSTNLISDPNFKMPTGWQRVREWFQGTSYIHVVAKNDGELEWESPFKILIFSIKQRIWIAGTPHTIWFPPDYGAPPTGTLEYRAGLEHRHYYHRGEDVVKLRINAGDHLFVDRLSYNFRPPKRGEIIVFDTHGIDRLPPDQQNTFYIKRLVGLGGETLSLQKDYILGGSPQGTKPVGHLVIDGKPLSASTPHFQSLYSFSGASRNSEVLQYREGHYFGHGLIGNLEPGAQFHVEPHHYFVMGDNTMNSSDSRYWGDFPEEKVIGKSFFVYWPITDRFGLGYKR